MQSTWAHVLHSSTALRSIARTTINHLSVLFTVPGHGGTSRTVCICSHGTAIDGIMSCTWVWNSLAVDKHAATTTSILLQYAPQICYNKTLILGMYFVVATSLHRTLTEFTACRSSHRQKSYAGAPFYAQISATVPFYAQISATVAKKQKLCQVAPANVLCGSFTRCESA